jgi:hypothetical protein
MEQIREHLLAEMKAHREELIAEMKTEMKANQEKLEAKTETHQERMGANQEKMELAIKNGQGEMKAMISSIQSKLEETIKNCMEDVLASVDQQTYLLAPLFWFQLPCHNMYVLCMKLFYMLTTATMAKGISLRLYGTCINGTCTKN